MNYTSEQLEDIIEKQLTDSERSGILCYIIGWMRLYDNPDFVKAVNSALKMKYMIKSKIQG